MGAEWVFTQGSHTFPEMKIKDFLGTFQGQNYIFQVLLTRYLP